MRTLRRLLAPALTAALALACAPTPSVGTRPRVDLTVITRAQIQELQLTNAYEAVKALRGNWLNVHGPESFRYPTPVLVYLDDVRMGDTSTLQSIPSGPIQFIRFYSGQEATAKWGIDHGAGAIYVSTKVGRQGVAPPPGGTH